MFAKIFKVLALTAIVAVFMAYSSGNISSQSKAGSHYADVASAVDAVNVANVTSSNATAKTLKPTEAFLPGIVTAMDSSGVNVSTKAKNAANDSTANQANKRAVFHKATRKTNPMFLTLTFV